MMQPKEMRALSIEQIIDELDASREELMRMRFQQATGELTDHNLPRRTRQKIARLMTILGEKRAEQEAEGEA